MSSSRFWLTLVFDLHFLKWILYWIVHKHVVCVSCSTNPSCKKIDFVIVCIARVSPSLQTSTIFYDFLPSELTWLIFLEKAFNVNSVHVAQKLIIVFAPSNDIEMGAYKCSAMESPLFWAFIIITELEFSPSTCLDIECPAVIEVDVRNSFSSINNQKGKGELCTVICALPGSFLWGVMLCHSPGHGFDVEDVNGVKSELV